MVLLKLPAKLNLPFWIALTCHRFQRIDDLSSMQDRVERSETHDQFGSDKSPDEKW